MINTEHIFLIAKKELRSYFDNPTAYIVLVVFLLLWQFLFFRQAFLIGEASLRGLFDLLPWLSLLLIPAITMGSISQEKSEGTLEFLLTHPLRDLELLAGKFLGAMGFMAVTLLFVFPIAMSLSSFGNLDWGVVIGQYLASLLISAVLVALGVFVSSLLSNQISSLLVAAAACFFLVIAGTETVTAALPLQLAPVLERLSVLSHFDSMSRGVIDVRDVWYALSATAIFVSLAYVQLLKRRFGNRRSQYRRYQTAIALFIGIAILTNVVGARIPGRLDLTQDKLYTLTPESKRALADLKDVVNVTLYGSGQLPAQLQPTLRDTKDILRDYETAGKGNVTVAYKDPSGNPAVAQEAASQGVREVQFNVIGQEELQVKSGFLGVAVAYAGKNEVIPFLQDTSELEYQLTGYITKLTKTEKKKLVFLSGHGEKSRLGEYGALNSELEKQFEVEEVTINDTTPKFPDNTAAVVVAGPTQTVDDKTKTVLREYLAGGGSALFLIDTVTLSQQTMSGTPNSNSLADFVSEYGVEVQPNLVYDLRSHETVQIGGGGFLGYAIPYPFWPRVAVVDRSSPVTAKLESLVLPWASSLTLNDGKLNEKGLTATKLLATTRFGGVQKDTFAVSPEQQLPEENLGEQIMAVSVSPKDAKATQQMRLIVVGDSEFIADQFVEQSPEALAFGIGTLSWLGGEESLAGVRLKQKAERKLFFEHPTQIALVKYGNMSLALVVPLGLGLWRLSRRRNLQRLTYTSPL